MRPAARRPPRRETPAAGALREEKPGREAAGTARGRGRRERTGCPGPSAKLGAPGTAVGSPQLSASGLAKAELACPQPSSNDGLLERSPRPAPPGRLEDRPLLLRAFGRWRPTIAGLRGTRGFWQGPGRKGMRAPGPQRAAGATSPRERPASARAGEFPSRETKAEMYDPHLAPHSVSRELGFHFPARRTGPLRQNKNKRSK